MGAFEERIGDVLPVASVGRIMRRVLPPGARISNEAKKAVQQCATELIKFVAEEAADDQYMICNKTGRRRNSINAHDLLLAFHRLQFHNYAATLRVLLHRLEQTPQQQQQQEEEEASTPNSTTTSSPPPQRGDDDNDGGGGGGGGGEIHAVSQEESQGPTQVQIQIQSQSGDDDEEIHAVPQEESQGPTQAQIQIQSQSGDDDEEIHAVPQEQSQGPTQAQIRSQGQEQLSAVALDPITFIDFETGVQYVFAFPD